MTSPSFSYRATGPASQVPVMASAAKGGVDRGASGVLRTYDGADDDDEDPLPDIPSSGLRQSPLHACPACPWHCDSDRDSTFFSPTPAVLRADDDKDGGPREIGEELDTSNVVICQYDKVGPISYPSLLPDASRPVRSLGDHLRYG